MSNLFALITLAKVLKNSISVLYNYSNASSEIFCATDKNFTT